MVDIVTVPIYYRHPNTGIIEIDEKSESLYKAGYEESLAKVNEYLNNGWECVGVAAVVRPADTSLAYTFYRKNEE